MDRRPSALKADIPLFSHAETSTVSHAGGREIKAARMLSDIASVAARLPDAPHVINACADRYWFAVALGAAMLREQVSVLPPDQMPETLADLAAAYRGLYALTDGPAAGGLPSIAVADAASAAGQAATNPLLPADRAAVMVFTSGSTGKPQPHVKSWGSLAAGAAAESERLGLQKDEPIGFVATVPAQHMYGLESSVVLPLCAGHAFHAGRPFYPADVQAALSQIPGRRGLITTPVHLRALVEADIDLPPLQLAICSTAPLPRQWAERFEARYRVPLHEIYGFTEAGMVATRRSARDADWETVRGLRIESRKGRLWAVGGHVSPPAAFPDEIELSGPGRFLLIGRGSDVVNVAGKRTSLAWLNRQLAEIPGVKDGVFVIPDDRPGEVVRPVAFAVAPGLTREQLLLALRGRIDPVFLPRPLHLVDSLPRNPVGKLQREALLRLVDGATSTDWQDEIRVPSDHPALDGHFPGNPVVPGAVLLDHVIDKAAGRLGRCPGPLEVLGAKFARPVRPGEALRLRLTAAGTGTLRFECFSGELLALSGVLRFER